jgi:SH3 domain-containing YSC84-like protein 1
MQRYDLIKVVNVIGEICSLQRQGLAIITVLKAGFLGSGRYGNGLVVTRLSDGSWSAPSAIGVGGAGFGGQIGFELTDFVFVLNDTAAVRAFSQLGSLTLGGNVSLAAGPIGRNAEATGAASLKGVAGVFGYSKTKGLFAGVSLEGSSIIERRDANEKLYGLRYTASQLLEGSVRPPPAANALMDVLNARVFAGISGLNDTMYNDVPQYDDRHDDVVWEGRRGSAYGEDQSKTAGLKGNQAVALYAFKADHPGDLGFKKGEIITVTKKTDKAVDWWYVFFLVSVCDEC